MTIHVAISGINASDNPGPGVPVARSLLDSKADIKTIGLSYDLHDAGNYLSSMFDASFILPYPSGGWDGIIAKLRHIKQTIGLDVIIPCLDAELPLYIKYQEALAKEDIYTFLPTAGQFKDRTKENLAQLAENLDLHHPKTQGVINIEQLQQALDEIKLPVYVKGNYYEAYPAYTKYEAIGHFTKIANKWGYPVLVQEVVSGEELNVVGMGDGKGNTVGLVAIKKLTTTSLGKIWNGVTIQNPALLAAAKQFVKLSNWRGPFELECIVEDERVTLIEINPRFPAWVYFATGIGINLPEQLIELAMGRPYTQAPDFAAGKLFIRHTSEQICDITDLSQLACSGERHGS
ncbi:MAG: ATP-grasp domain-containing protein [Magnetococcales bacterium]|nr:ATP-grasp domain-containing protein [Magnetococcales bacterium]